MKKKKSNIIQINSNIKLINNYKIIQLIMKTKNVHIIVPKIKI